MSYKIDYDFTQVERYFNDLSFGAIDKLKNFIGNELVEVSMEAFENESDPETGVQWPASARAENTEGQTLQDKGNLKDSIAYNITRDAIEAGTPLIYGRIHMEGQTVKAKNRKCLAFSVEGEQIFVKNVKIPQRRYLGIPGDFENRIFGDPAVQRLLGAS